MLYLVRYAMQTLKIRKFYGGKMNMKKNTNQSVILNCLKKKINLNLIVFHNLGEKMDIISEIKRDSSYTLLTVRIRIRCALNYICVLRRNFEWKKYSMYLRN